MVTNNSDLVYQTDYSTVKELVYVIMKVVHVILVFNSCQYLCMLEATIDN